MTATRPSVLLVGGPDVDARIELMQHLRAEFDISAAGSSEAIRAAFAAADLPYYSYPLTRRANPLMDMAAVTQLYRLFRTLRPSIVHAFDTKPCVWARMAARAVGVPVVIGTITAMGTLYMDSSIAARLLRICYQPLLRMAAYSSTMTIFYNRADIDYCLQHSLIPRERCMLIPGSGVPTAQLQPGLVPEEACARVRRDADIQPGDLVITMIARLIRSKGVLEYAQAARRVRARHPQVKCLLVGPTDVDSIEVITDSVLAPYRDTLTILGERRDVAAILRVSDIFVLPSYREGIARVLMEAAAMCLPLITTDAPGCREVVEDDVNGILVPVKDVDRLTDAMLALVEDPARRDRYSHASRHLATTAFDTSFIADQLAGVYRSLVANVQ